MTQPDRQALAIEAQIHSLTSDVSDQAFLDLIVAIKMLQDSPKAVELLSALSIKLFSWSCRRG